MLKQATVSLPFCSSIICRAVQALSSSFFKFSFGEYVMVWETDTFNKKVLESSN